MKPYTERKKNVFPLPQSHQGTEINWTRVLYSNSRSWESITSYTIEYNIVQYYCRKHTWLIVPFRFVCSDIINYGKVVNILPLVDNIRVIREENFQFCLATAADCSIDSIYLWNSIYAVCHLQSLAIEPCNNRWSLTQLVFLALISFLKLYTS